MAAAMLLRNQKRMVVYLPSLRAMVKHFRTFSSYDENRMNSGMPTYEASVTDSENQWPDERFGPLAPLDERFPLPGNVGPVMPPVVVKPNVAAPPEPDILTAVLPQERQVSILQQYLTIPRESTEPDQSALEASCSNDVSIGNNLECQALDCPDLMKKDFQDLFPGRDLSASGLTVLTVSQRTLHDQSGWNPDVEEERECLLEQFILSAQEMCESLKKAGYWADFIDPSSGKPYLHPHSNDEYLGPHTNATMFETDERYRTFGFEIEDLGCCKVIRHHVWGTHAYVGCLFTNAPADHPLLMDMMKKTDWEEC